MKNTILKLMTGMIDKRDEIVYRKLGGNKISWIENKYWDVMDKVLEYSLPAPSPLPISVKNAIEEVNTLIKTRK